MRCARCGVRCTRSRGWVSLAVPRCGAGIRRADRIGSRVRRFRGQRRGMGPEHDRHLEQLLPDVRRQRIPVRSRARRGRGLQQRRRSSPSPSWRASTARSPAHIEQRASLPTWTTLGFGDGTTGGEYGLPGQLGLLVRRDLPGRRTARSPAARSSRPRTPDSTVGGYLAGLNTNNQPTVGGTGIVPITGAPAGPATVDIRYSNGSGSPADLLVRGQRRGAAADGAHAGELGRLGRAERAGDTGRRDQHAGDHDHGRRHRASQRRLPGGLPEHSASAPTTVAPATVGTATHYLQSLDMRTGTLTTSFDWTSLAGRRTSFTYTVNANRATGHLGTVSLRGGAALERHGDRGRRVRRAGAGPRDRAGAPP